MALSVHSLYLSVQICSWALVTLQHHLWAWQTNSRGEVPGAAFIHQNGGGPSRRGVWWGQTPAGEALQPGALYQSFRHLFRPPGPWGPLLPDRRTVQLGLHGLYCLFSHMCCWWGFWNGCCSWTVLDYFCPYLLSFHVQLVLLYVLCPGKQKAVVRCVNKKQGEEVEDSLCDSSSRPQVMIHICNPEPCPPRWETHRVTEAP